LLYIGHVAEMLQWRLAKRVIQAVSIWNALGVNNVQTSRWRNDLPTKLESILVWFLLFCQKLRNNVSIFQMFTAVEQTFSKTSSGYKMNELKGA